MELALIALGVTSLLEVILWLPALWPWRKTGATVLIVPLAIVSGLPFGLRPAVWTALLAFFGLYRLVNLLRVVEGRPHSEFLASTVRRTAWFLIGLQLAVLGLTAWQYHFGVSLTFWFDCLVATQLGCACVLVASTRRHLRTTKPPKLNEAVADRDLPTLTVAIPARNETDDLEACLRSLTASDYPKLEILVLDDCSQLKRTPEIIRAFAHDGVRFLSGEVPPERWLAKNYAYKQLSEEANGELLLFCGVDARFQTTTLRRLVEVMLGKHKQMISIMPRNEIAGRSHLSALLLQPSRYAWELALPRRLVKRPPVLSTCWMSFRRVINEAGGFSAVSRSISPESYFARWAAAHDDGYSFLQSDDSVGLVCQKSVDEQRATAVRTRYPQLHRRPELAGLLTLLELAWLVAPFGMFIAALLLGHRLFALLELVVCVCLLVFYAMIVNFTYRRFSFAGQWLLPVAAVYDVILLNVSMWQYEFRQVIWKDRNVCIPVMQVVPSLPKRETTT